MHQVRFGISISVRSDIMYLNRFGGMKNVSVLPTKLAKQTKDSHRVKVNCIAAVVAVLCLSLSNNVRSRLSNCSEG